MRTVLTSTLLLVTVSFAGCVSAPPNNAPFSEAVTVESLSGVYKNLGESGGGGPYVYLSEILWPKMDLHHSDITRVKVVAVDSITLRVYGLTETGIAKESTFVEGRDFDLSNGKITIRRGPGIAGLKPGEPMLGAYYEDVTLGIDTAGHGKYHSTFAATGLGFLFIPMALAGSEDTRFTKLSSE